MSDISPHAHPRCSQSAVARIQPAERASQVRHRQMVRVRQFVVLLLVACLAGCGSSTTPIRHRITSRSLSVAQSTRIVHWFTQLRACLAQQGLELGPVVLRQTMIMVTVDSAVSANVLSGQSLGCTEHLGVPPGGSLLHASSGRLALRLPQMFHFKAATSHVGRLRP